MSAKMFRATLVAVAAFGFAALAAMFVPTEYAGSDCGTWPAPEYSDARMAELAESYAGVDVELLEAFGEGDRVAGLAADARRALTKKTGCDDALRTRRNLTLGLLAALVVMPAAAVFVGRQGPP